MRPNSHARSRSDAWQHRDTGKRRGIQKLPVELLVDVFDKVLISASGSRLQGSYRMARLQGFRMLSQTCRFWRQAMSLLPYHQTDLLDDVFLVLFSLRIKLNLCYPVILHSTAASSSNACMTRLSDVSDSQLTFFAPVDTTTLPHTTLTTSHFFASGLTHFLLSLPMGPANSGAFLLDVFAVNPSLEVIHLITPHCNLMRGTRSDRIILKHLRFLWLDCVEDTILHLTAGLDIPDSTDVRLAATGYRSDSSKGVFTLVPTGHDDVHFLGAPTSLHISQSFETASLIAGFESRAFSMSLSVGHDTTAWFNVSICLLTSSRYFALSQLKELRFGPHLPVAWNPHSSWVAALSRWRELFQKLDSLQILAIPDNELFQLILDVVGPPGLNGAESALCPLLSDIFIYQSTNAPQPDPETHVFGFVQRCADAGGLVPEIHWLAPDSEGQSRDAVIQEHIAQISYVEEDEADEWICMGEAL